MDAPVDAHAHETLCGEIFQQLELLALALAHHRGEQCPQPGPPASRQHLVGPSGSRYWAAEIDAWSGQRA